MSVKFSIDVSLPVFKQLTLLLEEGQTHDDIIRELLKSDSPTEPELDGPDQVISLLDDTMARAMAHGRGFASRGLFLPNGTELRARYKQREYRARIENGLWLSETDGVQSSPSSAATSITGTNVNGLRFWEGKRPNDNRWRRLEMLLDRK